MVYKIGGLKEEGFESLKFNLCKDCCKDYNLFTTKKLFGAPSRGLAPPGQLLMTEISITACIKASNKLTNTIPMSIDVDPIIKALSFHLIQAQTPEQVPVMSPPTMVPISNTAPEQS